MITRFLFGGALIFLSILLLVPVSVHARSAYDLSEPGRYPQSQRAQQVATEGAMHQVGQLVLAISNCGTFGTGFFGTLGIETADVFTGQTIPAGGGEYPKGSNNQYVYSSSFWIGAVRGRDTLVSVGADGWELVTEFFPDVPPFGKLRKRTIIQDSPWFSENAVSEEDYIAVYTDTFVNLAPPDAGDANRPHRPLYIEVSQRSYAWSYSYAEDFVLFDFDIKNIGRQTLNGVYMGVYVDADVTYAPNIGFQDDICGFLLTADLERQGYAYKDTVYAAWIADNDGELDNTDPAARPLPHITATRIVRTPAESLDVSFNWWIGSQNPPDDFGPRERPFKGKWKEPFRDYGTGGTGTPQNDRNKYYVMRNREFDYDQVRTGTIKESDTLWLTPPSGNAGTFARGYDTRYLLSFGPFDIAVGQSLPLTFAYVAGENFHRNPGNLSNLPDNPDAYYSNVSFDSLATNAAWAEWIYDNPGVDTDSDGYSGEFFVVLLDTAGIDSTAVIDSLTGDTLAWNTLDTLDADTVYTSGDDVPDFRGASPPPAPRMWLYPEYGRIRVRFNGLQSETTADVFSGDIDFEGYRIYLGRDNRNVSYSVITSYDIEDYNTYVFEFDTTGRSGTWVLNGTPRSLQQLRDAFGDQDLDPLEWTQSRPYIVPGGPDGFIRYYFEPQDYNVADLTDDDGIQKIYPEAEYPSTLDPDLADPEELTEDGYLKYFEYEYVIEDLLPSVLYYVSVTSFDFGSPESGLQALETAVTLNSASAYALPASDEVAAEDLKVVVYPNPYRIDAGYRRLGFEGLGEEDRPDDRVRAIHFANLPPKCTINIFTLDGDLVREIRHDMNPSDPNASHDQWDLITRNTQRVVSGLYYWTVEADDGTVQIGKLAIIM